MPPKSFARFNFPGYPFTSQEDALWDKYESVPKKFWSPEMVALKVRVWEWCQAHLKMDELWDN